MSFITSNDGQFAYFDTQLRSPNWKGKSVLDFGGNIGNVLHHPRSTIDQDKYWCIDVSVHAIVAGKRAAPEANFIFYDRYNFEYNPVGRPDLAIPVNGNKFDLVLALSVFTHMPRPEMIELVSGLEKVLSDEGRLAFTFFDPHYVPPDSDVCNLKYYFKRRWPGLPEAEIDARLESARRASWCTLANGELEVEDEGLDKLRGYSEKGYLGFYTPDYFQSLFPRGEIWPPVEPFPRQHCCVITKGKLDG
ncbi:MAG TPA: class I SAM-dependent methyltransferase [Pyrinomonadaceae bacterium]|nr:class I SAM-dependent methyltransferase [Pyrinomonadaceae bacterium]